MGRGASTPREGSSGTYRSGHCFGNTDICTAPPLPMHDQHSRIIACHRRECVQQTDTPCMGMDYNRIFFNVPKFVYSQDCILHWFLPLHKELWFLKTIAGIANITIWGQGFVIKKDIYDYLHANEECFVLDSKNVLTKLCCSTISCLSAPLQ